MTIVSYHIQMYSVHWITNKYCFLYYSILFTNNSQKWYARNGDVTIYNLHYASTHRLRKTDSLLFFFSILMYFYRHTIIIKNVFCENVSANNPAFEIIFSTTRYSFLRTNSSVELYPIEWYIRTLTFLLDIISRHTCINNFLLPYNIVSTTTPLHAESGSCVETRPPKAIREAGVQRVNL